MKRLEKKFGQKENFIIYYLRFVLENYIRGSKLIKRAINTRGEIPHYLSKALKIKICFGKMLFFIPGPTKP